MTTLKWTSVLTVATAVSLTALSSAATELASDRAPTMTVRAWDLNLRDASDVQTLYGRVQDAANRLCRAEAHRHWMTTRRRPDTGWAERCAVDAVDATVRNLGDPLLAAMHIRTGVALRD